MILSCAHLCPDILYSTIFLLEIATLFEHFLLCSDRLSLYTTIAQTALGEYLYNQLALVGGLTLYGPATTTGAGAGAKRTGLVAFNCDTVHATDLSFFLDQEGVAVRTGTSCFHQTLDLKTCYIPCHVTS